MRRTCRTPARRRGAVIALFAFMLTLVVVAMVYAIDISRMQLTRSELRAAADSAARAGAEALLRTENETQAKQAAVRIAAAHNVAGEPLAVTFDDITLGRCYSRSSGPWQFVPGEKPFNAVRVDGRRTSDSAAGPVDLFLGKILGAGQFEPEQSAVAAQANQQLAIVIESSGSMHAHDRWEGVCATVDKLGSALKRAANETQLCLIECKNEPQLLSTFQQSDLTIDDAIALVQGQLEQVKLRQARNLGGGLMLATETLHAASSGTHLGKRILFIGSGNNNKGDPIAAARLAASRRQVIYSILVGKGADRKGVIAEAVRITGGKQFHLDEMANLDEALDQIVRTTAIITTE